MLGGWFLRVYRDSEGYERVGELHCRLPGNDEQMMYVRLDAPVLSYTIPVISLRVLVVLVIDVRERLCFQSIESFMTFLILQVIRSSQQM